MASEQPSLRVFVESSLSADGFWSIRSQLRFPGSASRSLMTNLPGEGRQLVVEGIVREALRAWKLGARRFRIHLDTGYRFISFPLPMRHRIPKNPRD